MRDIHSPKRTNALRLAGRRFGRLKVLRETDQRGSNGCIIWRCQCRCGQEVMVLTSNLTSGNTLSCGCLQLDRSREANAGTGPRWQKH